MKPSKRMCKSGKDRELALLRNESTWYGVINPGALAFAVGELEEIANILDEQAEEIARLKERLNKVSS